MSPSATEVLLWLYVMNHVTVLGTLLFGIKPTDPLTLSGVVAVFVTVALAAMYVPAQRAIRVDPLQTLRQD